MRNNHLVSALILAFFVASLYSAVLVVVKEEYKPVYNALKTAFGHHWIGHGVTTLIVFAIFAFIFRATNLKLNDDEVVWILWAGVLLNFIIIAGYFAIHLA